MVMSALPAYPQPYIMSEPQTDASIYRLRLSTDGTTWGPWFESPPVNNALKFSIADVPKGVYKGEAQAGATTTLKDEQSGVETFVTEWSQSGKFILNRKQGNAPTTLKVVP